MEKQPDSTPSSQSMHPDEKPSTTILLNTSLALLVVFLVTRLMLSGLFQEARMPSVNKFIELFAALALLFWVVAVLLQGRMALARTGVRIPVLIFMVLTVLSIAQASYPFSASHTAATWLVHISTFFLVINLSFDRRRRRVILTVVIATSIVVAILAFYQYFFGFAQMQEDYNVDPSKIVIPDNMRQQFLGRLHLNEVFSTFLQSNIFGGYLIMVLPLLFFLLHAAVSSPRRTNAVGKESETNPKEKISVTSVLSVVKGIQVVLTIGCVATAVALYLTGSKGAWLGLLAGALLFALMYWVHRRPAGKRQRARLYAILAIAAFVVLIVAVMLALGYDRLPYSAKVRLGYWHAGLRMATHNPLGVGAGNFQENYTIYQAHWATEVKNPHNSYLAIWTELGIAGLAAFLTILFLAGRRYLAALKGFTTDPQRKNSDKNNNNKKNGSSVSSVSSSTCSTRGETRQFHLVVLLAGTAGFVFLAIIAGRFAEVSLSRPIIGLAAPVWILLTAGLLCARKLLDSPFAMAGIALGLLAFCCHAFIDFTFYSHGVNATFWVLLGLILSECCRLEGWRKVPERLTRLSIATAVVIIAIVLFFGSIYIPHAMHADSQAKLALTQFEKAAREGFPKPMVLAAAAEFEAAGKLSHWNARNYSKAAELYDMLSGGDFAYTAKAAKYYTRAIKLRRNSHYEYLRRGMLRFRAAETPEAAREALADIETAATLYPINAEYHYYLGEYLDRLADMFPQEAAPWKKLHKRAQAEYEEALRLDSAVVFPRGKLTRFHRRILQLRLKH